MLPVIENGLGLQATELKISELIMIGKVNDQHITPCEVIVLTMTIRVSTQTNSSTSSVLLLLRFPS